MVRCLHWETTDLKLTVAPFRRPLKQILRLPEVSSHTLMGISVTKNVRRDPGGVMIDWESNCSAPIDSQLSATRVRTNPHDTIRPRRLDRPDRHQRGWQVYTGRDRIGGLEEESDRLGESLSGSD